MIIAIGIDVASIERMRTALARHGDRFLSRICSATEREELGTRADRVTAVAGRFAIKEAFSKCLDGARGVGWHEVQVRRTSSGRPELVLSGSALALAERFGADRFHVSLSHDAGVAAAVVIAERMRP